MKKNSSTIIARNLPKDSLVFFSNHYWRVHGLVSVHDGNFECSRVLLFSAITPMSISFLYPHDEFLQIDSHTYISLSL